MFKKTPIALAILMLSASISYAQSQQNLPAINDDFGMFYRYDNGSSGFKDLGRENNGKTEYKKNMNATTLVDLQSKLSNEGDWDHNSTVLFSNYDVFKYETDNETPAIVGGPGVVGFGLSLVEGVGISQVHDVEDGQIWQDKESGEIVQWGDDETCTVIGHQNPKVLVEAFDELLLQSGTKTEPGGKYAIYTKVEEGQEDSDIFIASYNTIIKTTDTSNDAYAIYLEGSETAIEEGDEQPNIVFLKADSDRLVQLNREYTYFWQDNSSQAANKNGKYGLDNNQTLTISGPKNALFLNHRATIDVHAGHVTFDGNVYLSNGSSLMMGFKEPQRASVPESLYDYIYDDNGSNEYMINSVTITAKNNQTDDKYGGVIPALRVENGSHFAAAAKKITISGYKNSDGTYGKAIWFDTKASDYIADKTNYKFPAILSIYADSKLEINGDIVLNNSDTGSVGIVDIQSKGALKINGNIYVTNEEGQSFNLAHLKLGKVEVLDLPAEDMIQVYRGQIQDTYISKTKSNQGSDVDQGTRFDISDNARMELTGDSVITTVQANQAHIDAGKSTVQIHNLDHLGDLTFYADTIQTGQFTLDNVVQPMAYSLRQRSVPTTPDLSFVVDSVPEGMSPEQIAKIVTFGNPNDNKGYTVSRYESPEATQLIVTVGAGADPTIESELQDNTSVAKSINDVAGLGVLAWRAQMNDVNKRLGDLRTYQGKSGGWARVYGSESEFGDMGLKSKSHTVQVGADTKIGDNFYFGATASYSDGKGTLNNGTTDDRSYSFGVYGGWMGNDGQFVDVIVKRANFKTDFDLRYTTGEQSTGSFDLWGTSLCAEYGWRLNVTDNVWVEPQAEITYGYMNDVTYTYSGVKATQEATESLVGRLGVALGTTFKSGSAYVKASVAHDWMGETEISMSNGNAAMKEDLGGTWGEFAVGGTYNFGNGWAVYGEFQTAHGSKMKTPWQYNLGARYVF